MARVVRFHETGRPEVLKIEDLDVPAPGPGEVQLRVHALGLNRAEAAFRSGKYLEVPRLPARIGYEAAGTVEAVGRGVEGYQPGDVVSVVPNFSMNQYGVYGEVVNVPATALARHPASLSWVEAAAVWMQYLTAYGALIDIASLRAGETVLITAASSSVGLAAIQMCRMVGAVPVALTRRSAKRAALEAAGAADVVATEEQDLVSEVQRITEGNGARIVLDPVGGPLVTNLTEAMARPGIFILYGLLSREPTPLPVLNVLSKGLTIRGYTLFEFTSDRERLERAMRFIHDGLASGALKPIIAKTFTLDEIVDAHQYMESNQQVGKIVVMV